ncbi:MAG: hypothetical protein U0T69_11145 [Chitinophagales bacterium]
MLYTDKYTDYETFAQIGEYRVEFPKMPPKNQIINYGLPIEKQKFRHTQYEINGHKIYAYQLKKSVWNKLSATQQSEIAATEWQRRKHGQWYYIGGKTIYIPGNFYHFLNYYTFIDGSKPQFWDSQWFSFLLKDWAFHHPFITTKIKVKGRRGGGTAEDISCNLDYTTRYKGSISGMMNKNKDEAKKINFDPMVHVLVNLPEFFQPKRSGELKPKSEIDFTPPSKRLTHKSFAAEETEYDNEDYLNSYLNFIATSEVGYDGGGMRYISIDEIFKWANVSPIKAIEIQSLCIMDGGQKNGVKDEFGNIKKHAGLLSALSSVEEIDDDQIQEVKKLWDATDPKTGTENTISSTGAIRYFEPFYFGLKGYMDEFGFSQTERAIKEYREREAQIRKTKGKKAALDFRRKHPETIEQAITPSAVGSVFNIEILTNARNNYYNKLPDDLKPISGKLEWIEKFRSVKWSPLPEAELFEAPFICSYIPNSNEKNSISYNTADQSFKPNNYGKFTIAVDPINHDIDETSQESKLSNAAFRVKRELDLTIDGDKFDENDEPINFGEGFETNRTVMHFCFRPEIAEQFFEYVAMAAIFYGAPVLMAATSKSMKKYFVDNLLGSFLIDSDGKQVTPKTLHTAGWKESKEAKDQQFIETDNYIGRYGLAERHIECIEDLLVVNKANLTHHDLSACYTISEVASTLFKKKFNKPQTESGTKKIQIRRKIIKPGKLRATWT